ncbi:hypothetical protein FRUB_04222 [Fimbriiglobus ruber]|uniref:Uncharacterized protein n=1 Tax=Fimbriiglobus ruber TaxID=1908690 RepID=A0A225DR82_9BACT|nr:hypothetical protein FRUB_04222 [Fimbriiglobus ruber]
MITDGDRRRDAVHIAVAPVTAAHALEPGQHVGFTPLGQTEMVGAVDPGQGIGIVDPFLTADVHAGGRFWMFLYPNTVTSLRHYWTHPSYAAKSPGAPVAPVKEG